MIEQQLAAYVASGPTDNPTALHGARRCVVDWFAATIAGADQPLGRALRCTLSEQLGVGSARLIPDGLVCPMTTAALINGATSHIMEFDDIYRDALYHPGSPVISASLAVCQGRHLSGLDLLQAVIKGYEISNRIGTACNPSHYRYWHTTATVGAIGAAAGAGAALQLSASKAHDCLANVVSIAGGLQQAFRSDAMTKPLHVGRAAENGVLTALASEHGVTGAAQMLTGDVGFGHAMSDHPDWNSVVDGLGEQFTIAHITHKNHGCCGHIFASIDAVLQLASQHTLTVENIETIEVATYQAALDITSRTHPKTAAEARFSTPWCISAALHLGAVRIAAFSTEALANEQIQALANKVRLRLDEDIQQKFPKRRQSRVKITLKNRKVLDCYAKTRRGDPDDPLSDDDLTDKLIELAAPNIGKTASQRLVDRLWTIDTLSDVSQVMG